MASLLVVPDDILLEIFEQLDNIDDSLHLGRYCVKRRVCMKLCSFYSTAYGAKI
jgi:hypothetical protein